MSITGPNTSCKFAEYVQGDYKNQLGGTGSGIVDSINPVTDRVYTMHCTAGKPHRCKGRATAVMGSKVATVHFP